MTSNYRENDLFLDLGLMATAGSVQYAQSLNKISKSSQKKILFVVDSKDFQSPKEFLSDIEDLALLIRTNLPPNQKNTNNLSFTWIYDSSVTENIWEHVVNEWAVIYVMKLDFETRDEKRKTANEFFEPRYIPDSQRHLIFLHQEKDKARPVEYKIIGTLRELCYGKYALKSLPRTFSALAAAKQKMQEFSYSVASLLSIIPCKKEPELSETTKLVVNYTFAGVAFWMFYVLQGQMQKMLATGNSFSSDHAPFSAGYPLNYPNSTDPTFFGIDFDN